MVGGWRQEATGWLLAWMVRHRCQGAAGAAEGAAHNTARPPAQRRPAPAQHSVTLSAQRGPQRCAPDARGRDADGVVPQADALRLAVVVQQQHALQAGGRRQAHTTQQVKQAGQAAAGGCRGAAAQGSPPCPPARHPACPPAPAPPAPAAPLPPGARPPAARTWQALRRVVCTLMAGNRFWKVTAASFICSSPPGHGVVGGRWGADGRQARGGWVGVRARRPQCRGQQQGASGGSSGGTGGTGRAPPQGSHRRRRAVPPPQGSTAAAGQHRRRRAVRLNSSGCRLTKVVHHHQRRAQPHGLGGREQQARARPSQPAAHTTAAKQRAAPAGCEAPPATQARVHSRPHACTRTTPPAPRRTCGMRGRCCAATTSRIRLYSWTRMVSVGPRGVLGEARRRAAGGWVGGWAGGEGDGGQGWAPAATAPCSGSAWQLQAVPPQPSPARRGPTWRCAGTRRCGWR